MIGRSCAKSIGLVRWWSKPASRDARCGTPTGTTRPARACAAAAPVCRSSQRRRRTTG
jgi:hypothetical protein